MVDVLKKEVEQGSSGGLHQAKLSEGGKDEEIRNTFDRGHETCSSTTASLSSDGEDGIPGRIRRDAVEDLGGDEEEENDGIDNAKVDCQTMEVEETEARAAASILTSVLPDQKKMKMTTKVPGEGYEDLLDCLASLASSRAPLMPLHCRVARMAVDDILVGSSSSGSRTSTRLTYKREALLSSNSNSTSPASSSPDAEEEDEEEMFSMGRRGRNRPRAISNPEGCDVWRKYESGAVGRSSSSSSSSSNSEKKAMLPPISPRGLGADGGGGEGEKQDAAGACPMLPQMLAKYSDIYNKRGRIGIYTREERDAIIARFREKRTRRIWAKKIRYSCRKNLADKRIRVKGRFVKLAPKGDGGMEEEDEEGDTQMVGFAREEGNSGGPRPVEVLSVIEEGKSVPEVEGAAAAAEGDEEVDSDPDFVLPTRRMRRHSFA